MFDIDSAVTTYPANLFVSWALNSLAVPCIVRLKRSGAHSTVYELIGKDGSWFLKIADDLTDEIERLKWLVRVAVAVPRLIAQYVDNHPRAILISSVPGTDLAELAETQSIETTVTQLAFALRQFHALDASKCPFQAYIPGSALVHGDACLPNIICKDGQLSGFVDLLDMGVGSQEVDLSAAIWSLQFNLGPGHGIRFLQEYGHANTTIEEVNRLHLMYEEGPIFKR